MHRPRPVADPAESAPIVRCYKPADATRAIQITTPFPSDHGAPAHVGLRHLIGINDIAKPDYGDAGEIRDDELPVF